MDRHERNNLRVSVKRLMIVLMASALSTMIPFHRHIKSTSRSMIDENREAYSSVSSIIDAVPAKPNSTKIGTVTGDSLLSPVCYPFASLASSGAVHSRRTIKRIYFAHMRKAGGTTLRTYLTMVAEKLGIQLRVSEGGHFEAPGADEHTLYVTHLRDPYRRSISHFQYEVRWPCSQLTQNSSFVPSLQNAANLTAWILDTNYQHPSLVVVGNEINYRNKSTTQQRHCDDTQKYLIDCAVNCYIRWMNYPSGACSEKVFERKSAYYYHALQTLRTYDVIIDTDRLFSGDARSGGLYAKGLEEFFGLDALQSRNSPMYCLRPSRNANRQFPLVIENATRRWFQDMNRADYDLYSELITCHTASRRIVFPSIGGGIGGYRLADFI